MTTPLVQAIARGFASAAFDRSKGVDPNWTQLHFPGGLDEYLSKRLHCYFPDAQAALNALTEDGYAVIKPRELADALVENLKGKVRA